MNVQHSVKYVTRPELTLLINYNPIRYRCVPVFLIAELSSMSPCRVPSHVAVACFQRVFLLPQSFRVQRAERPRRVRPPTALIV
jgi:hypothetical protein